jgi:hypothetical protein
MAGACGQCQNATIEQNVNNVNANVEWLLLKGLQSPACVSACAYFFRGRQDLKVQRQIPRPSRTSRIWHGRRDSNPDRTVLETGTLPLSYTRVTGTG